MPKVGFPGGLVEMESEYKIAKDRQALLDLAKYQDPRSRSPLGRWPAASPGRPATSRRAAELDRFVRVGVGLCGKPRISQPL